MTAQVRWSLKGSIIGACSCDWGCPCSFNAPPTQGWCQGGYSWHIQEGRFDSVPLDGLHISWMGQSPGPLHEGHVTAQYVIDQKADERQRDALLTILRGDVGGPFAIFATVTETLLDPIYATSQSLRISHVKARPSNVLHRIDCHCLGEYWTG